MPQITQATFVETAALLPPLLFQHLNDDDGGEDPFVSAFPLAARDTWLIRWDQKDNPYGLMPQGSLDVAPTLMTLPGRKVYEVEPAAYRMYTEIKESELTKSVKAGTLADPMDVDERLADGMLYLTEMLANRLYKMYADLGTSGAINNTDANGNQHTYQINGYQNLSVSAWAGSPTTATPIDDLRAAQQTLNKGTSSRFGQRSRLLMADEGVSALLATTQIRNSFRSQYGASFLAPFDNAMKNGPQPPINGDRSLNSLFVGMGLPEIVPWNRGYYATLADARDKVKGNFAKFLGSTKAVWLGYRPNKQPLGQVTFAKHASLEGPAAAEYGIAPVKKPGSLSEFGQNLFVQCEYENRQPAHYRIEMGCNVCPEVWYEDAMASVTWS